MASDLMDPEFWGFVSDGLRRCERASMALAEQGWTTPYWFVPRQTVELLGDGSPDEVDAGYVSLYDADDGAAYVEHLRSTLLGHARLARWRTLLVQVDSAYGRGDFAITIPSLLVVLEGLVMGDEGDSIRVKAAVKRRASEAGSDTVESWLWRAVGSFVDQIYRNAPFTGDRPPVLNRHWILHGRDAAGWTQADSLRLMQAIEVICSLDSMAPVEQAHRADAAS